jgi:hypothetical protein
LLDSYGNFLKIDEKFDDLKQKEMQKIENYKDFIIAYGLNYKRMEFKKRKSTQTSKEELLGELVVKLKAEIKQLETEIDYIAEYIKQLDQK